MNEKLIERYSARMVKGVKVKMVDCMEATGNEDRVWTIRSEKPVKMCGDWVVWLEEYAGAFCCEFLQIDN